MKYWWISKYLEGFKKINENNIKSKKNKQLIKDFLQDYEYYFTIPKNYLSYYKKIKKKKIEELNDYELQISLSYYIYHGKIMNFFEQSITSGIIYKILFFLSGAPNTSLPASNYTLEEMLEEISNLKNVLPTPSKLDNNNIASCYSCRNIFYIDNIYQVKNNLCLCPYCNNSTIYFDNDYIPMDYNFISLAYLIYQDKIKYKDIIKVFQEKVKINKNDKKDYFHLEFRNKKEKDIITPEKRIINILKKEKNISFEERLASTLYHTFLELEKENIKNLVIVINEEFEDKQTSLTMYTTIINYFINNYFSQLEKIIIKTTSTIYYENYQTLITKKNL